MNKEEAFSYIKKYRRKFYVKGIVICFLIFAIASINIGVAVAHTFSSEFGKLGSGDGEFGLPSGITKDASGNIIVTDNNMNRIQIFSPTGTYLSKFGSSGSGNGQFDRPNG